jgi:hypothetical protein
MCARGWGGLALLVRDKTREMTGTSRCLAGWLLGCAWFHGGAPGVLLLAVVFNGGVLPSELGSCETFTCCVRCSVGCVMHRKVVTEEQSREALSEKLMAVVAPPLCCAVVSHLTWLARFFRDPLLVVSSVRLAASCTQGCVCLSWARSIVCSRSTFWTRNVVVAMRRQ